MGAMAPFRIIDAGIRKTTGELGGQRLVGLRFFCFMLFDSLSFVRHRLDR